MITPAQTSNVVALPRPSQFPAALANPPAPPSATTSAINANMGPLPPNVGPQPPIPGPLPAPPPEAIAKFAVQISARWLGEMNRMASLMGVNLGGSLQPIERDQQRVLRDLKRQVSPQRLTADTNRLLDDWGKQVMDGLPRLRQGFVRNTEGELRKIATDLPRNGVVSPQLQSGFREIHDLVRYLESARPPIPISQVRVAIDRAMARLTQAGIEHVRRHPEDMQAIQSATLATRTAVNRTWGGLFVLDAMRTQMAQDLASLGWRPPLPGPAAPAM